MLWAYCLPFYWEFQQLQLDDNKIMEGLKFNKRYGLKGFSANVNDFAEMEEGERNRILDYINENDMHLFPIIGYKYITATDEEAKRETERTLENMEQWIPQMRALSTFTGGG